MIRYCFLIGCLLSIFILPSCTSRNTALIDPNYAAYQQAMLTQINQEPKPLIDLQIGEDGRIEGIKMYPERKVIRLTPYNPPPHPAWKSVNTAITAVGTVFGIREGGKALERVINASSGDTTYKDSYNPDSSNHSDHSTTDKSEYTDDNSTIIDDHSTIIDDHSSAVDDNSVVSETPDS